VGPLPAQPVDRGQRAIHSLLDDLLSRDHEN
jgi:hypothetical protein